MRVLLRKIRKVLFASVKCTSIVYLLVIIALFSCRTERDKIEEQSQTGLSVTALSDVPEWAKEVIWYQIFVDRFRNGDPNNDPTREDIEGTYPGIIPDGWKVTPWTHDWYKPDPYFSELEGEKDFLGNEIKTFGQKAQLRRYGGDLQGVLDKLDYLDSLGVTAIYFNPINDAPSLHKYDARHWRHIDRNFGPDPRKDVKTMAMETPDDPNTWIFTEADKMFLRIVDEFHKRGIKVILDYSWNHTGHTFWAWKDLVKNGLNSKYKDWYWVIKFDDPKTEKNEFEYRGWFGVAELPEIKETEYHDHLKYVAPFDGDIVAESAKEHIFNVSRRWLDPNDDGDPSDGVDGFRLDVAAELPLSFWREYRKVIRDINPNAYLIGEVWWEQYPDKLLDPKQFLEGDIFDAVMNYRWYRIARHFFNSSPNEISISKFVDSLQSLSSNLRKQNNYAMMNLMASHDVPRVATSLFNKNKYKFEASPFANKDYKITKPDAITYETLKLFLAHQFTYIGAPHIWAGDEMGMWGADDPDNRKPLIWPDHNFEPEVTHPLGKKRTEDEVKFNEKLFTFYQHLISVRKSNPVLMYGDIDFVLKDDENKLLAYSRFDDNNEVLVIFNTGEEEQTVQVPIKTKQMYIEVLSNLAISQLGENIINLELPARRAAILIGGNNY